MDYLEKLSTIQKNGKLNDVYRVAVVGPGGAYHDYEIHAKEPIEKQVVDVPDLNHVVGMIGFQKGARKSNDAIHGVLDCDLLEIVRDRLKCFQQGEFATRENAIALTHIEEALLWMNKRVEDRIERDVLGTYTV